jgi:hypothetical protein
VEAEGFIKGSIVDEDGEQGENVEEVSLVSIVNEIAPRAKCMSYL